MTLAEKEGWQSVYASKPVGAAAVCGELAGWPGRGHADQDRAARSELAAAAAARATADADAYWPKETSGRGHLGNGSADAETARLHLDTAVIEVTPSVRQKVVRLA